ncbi:hypothetical protein FQA39_LY17348 [Lamprigera yunnana]|nr:hypothetical protein FQA39_LY17348 [Lamprigera yunnana]
MNSGATSRMICSTALDDEADRKGLIGVECSYIRSSLRQVCLTKTVASALKQNDTISGLKYKETPESASFHSRLQRQEEIHNRFFSGGNVKSALTALPQE